MSRTLKISDYGLIISGDDVGSEILSNIREIISSGDSVIVDFNGVYAMATYCAKQIFGELFVTLGEAKFKQLIKIPVSTSDDIRETISEGVIDAVNSKR